MSFIEEREKVGTKASVVGIVTNAALFGLKFILGSMMRSVAVIADGFNNLSDAASSIVSLIGFKVAGKKPDAKHPFGYGRIEYIAALVVSFLILTINSTVRPSCGPMPCSRALCLNGRTMPPGKSVWSCTCIRP
ncbi:MAG: cation diffusion facilitator family transporter [Spirochaetales bacterium]|nr:cation diffusion facilitator family transporter [Spirochaetales bacterium]